MKKNAINNKTKLNNIKKSGNEKKTLINKNNDLKEILSIIEQNTNHDLSNYKKNTLYRRIEKRISSLSLKNISSYIKYLKNNKKEPLKLFEEIFIHLTNFFRDNNAFNALKEKAIPLLLNNVNNNYNLRVWVPGCSTGEEAYSAAITLLEYRINSKKKFNIQVFATDIDEKSINKGRKGLYPLNILENVSKERLKKFFTKDKNSYKVNKIVREIVTFAPHDILKDPPFSKIDLICCRNLLIYLDSEIQSKLMKLFNYSLNNQGILFLGDSETIGKHADLFDAVDKKYKIYKCIKSNSKREFNKIKLQIGQNKNLIIKSNSKIKKPDINKNTKIQNTRHLKQELSEVKEQLQNTKEEFDTSNEELKSTVEELNSINEELSTLNLEYQVKIEELTKANNDIYNLLSGTKIATIFLDKKLNIKWFTKGIDNIINLIESDIGRPIDHITNNLFYNDFKKDSLIVINSLNVIEKEIKSKNNNWYLLKIMPYRTINNIVEGVVITFFEITEKKIIDDKLKENEHFLIMAQEIANIGHFKFNPYNNVVEGSDELFKIFGLTREEFQFTDFVNSVHPDQREFVTSTIADAVKNASKYDIEHYLILRDKTLKYVHAKGEALLNEEGKTEFMIGTVQDITERKNAEDKILKTNEILKLAQESSKAGAWDWNIKDNVFYWSEEFLRLFGIDNTVKPGFDVWSNALHPDDRNTAADTIQKSIDEKKDLVNDYRIIMPDKKIKWIRSAGKTFYKNDKPVRMIGLCVDITEIKKTEEQLKEKQKIQEITTNMIPDIIYLYNTKESKHIYINKELAALLGYSTEEIKKEGADLIIKNIHPEDLNKVLWHIEILKTTDSDEIYKLEYRIKGKSGKYLWFYVREQVYQRDSNNKPEILFGICQNVTERKEKDQAILDSEYRYRELFNNMRSGVAVYQVTENAEDFIFKDFNKAGEKIDNDKKENIIGKSIFDVRPGIKDFGLLDVFKRVWKSGVPENFPIKEYKDNKLSGWYDNYVYKLPTGEIVAVFDNLTENKKNEEKISYLLERINLAKKVANIGIWDWYIQKKELFWDDQMYELYGINKKDYPNAFDAWRKCIHPDDKELNDEISNQAIKGLKNYDTEYRIIRNDGSMRNLKAIGEIFKDSNGTVVRMLGVNYDITDQKNAETKLKSMLTEKEILLKEIHHRVKNNLSVINSLINLQSFQTDDQKNLDIFKELSNRIMSMSLVHEELYKSDNLSKIDMKIYFQKLAINMKKGYGQTNVNLKIIMPDIYLNIEKALPCGLIATELITNSLKYAFDETWLLNNKEIKEAEIKIELNENSSGYIFTVSDNGKGLPLDFDIINSKKLGMNIVNNLAISQLSGSIELNKENGTSFTINFK